jgi:hypothetical protein
VIHQLEDQTNQQAGETGGQAASNVATGGMMILTVSEPSTQ